MFNLIISPCTCARYKISCIQELFLGLECGGMRFMKPEIPTRLLVVFSAPISMIPPRHSPTGSAKPQKLKKILV